MIRTIPRLLGVDEATDDVIENLNIVRDTNDDGVADAGVFII